MKYILSLTLLITSLFAQLDYTLKTECTNSYNSNLFSFSGDKVERFIYTININDDSLYENIYVHHKDNKLYGKQDILFPVSDSEFTPKIHLINSKTLKKIYYENVSILEINKNNKNLEILFRDGIENNLSLMVEYYQNEKIKVKEKLMFTPFKIVNGKLTQPEEYVIKEYYNPKLVSKIYPLDFPLSESDKAICENQFQTDLSNDFREKITEIIGLILWITLFLGCIYLIYKAIVKSYNYAKEKKIQIYKDIEDRRIRKIAEEESIRESVKKSFSDGNDEELKKLQELINSAVAKGDSETAQTLLKILNSKKNE